MNSKLEKGIILAIGAATGAVIAWHFTKKYYADISKMEIESVKSSYNVLAKRLADKNRQIKEATDINTASVDAIRNIMNTYSAADDVIVTDDISDAVVELHTVEPSAVNSDTPYTISPEEFGNQDDYDLITLTYYADNVLTDDADDPIDPEDIEKIVGIDNLNTFGEYDDYTVYVRNDKRKCDYEILLAEDNYGDSKNEEVSDY